MFRKARELAVLVVLVLVGIAWLTVVAVGLGAALVGMAVRK